MSDESNPITQLLKADPRYRLEAYQFVREALSYAQDVLQMTGAGKKSPKPKKPSSSEESSGEERHLTGQQLCEAIRLYALDQYGYMAQTVLNSWGITNTADFGEIVYNLIDIGFMKKSDSDRKEDFHDAYDFDVVFRKEFQIELPE